MIVKVNGFNVGNTVSLLERNSEHAEDMMFSIINTSLQKIQKSSLSDVYLQIKD